MILLKKEWDPMNVFFPNTDYYINPETIFSISECDYRISPYVDVVHRSTVQTIAFAWYILGVWQHFWGCTCWETIENFESVSEEERKVCIGRILPISVVLLGTQRDRDSKRLFGTPKTIIITFIFLLNRTFWSCFTL